MIQQTWSAIGFIKFAAHQKQSSGHKHCESKIFGVQKAWTSIGCWDTGNNVFGPEYVLIKSSQLFLLSLEISSPKSFEEQSLLSDMWFISSVSWVFLAIFDHLQA